MTHQLLFEIGCEELPSSFVESALNALPALAEAADGVGFISLGGAKLRIVRQVPVVLNAVGAMPESW